MAGVQPAIIGQLQEQLRVLATAPHNRARPEAPQGRQGGGGVGGREPRGENESGGGVLQVLNQDSAAGEISAGTPQGLAERPHPKVTRSGIDAVMFADSSSRGAHDADRVRLVDVQHALCRCLTSINRGKSG